MCWICLRYTGFPFALFQSVHMHMLSEPGLITLANSNFVYLPNSKPIVRGIRPISCQKGYCCMYIILNGLFVTSLSTLKQMKQVFGLFFFSPDGRTRSWGEEKKKIIITHAVHQGTQTSLWPYLKKRAQRNSHCSYNRGNLVCISKESHFGENYRIITHMLRSRAFNEADNILRI